MRRREFMRRAGCAALGSMVAPRPDGARAQDASTAAPPAGGGLLQLTDLFVAGQGYDTFRIPSLLATPTGALLAFCEGRRDGRGDSGDIDLLVRRSADAGTTWSAPAVVWDDGGNTCGNPCPVVERSTGAIRLLLTHNLGVDREPQIIAGESRGTRTVWIASSEDDGRSWSAPREITRATKDASWTWYATGPGVGIQIERGGAAGRLVVPCDHIEARTERYFSHVILSDDGGASWRIGGRSPVDQVNECQVVELVDGRLMLNMRNYDPSRRHRAVCYSRDGGESWTGFTNDSTLIEPICQASLIRHAWPTATDPGRLLFSNPASVDERVDLTVRASTDDGRTWPLGRRLHAGPSAYSCLAPLTNGAIGCLYERGAAHPYERITLARFDMAWLRGTGR